MPKGVGCALRLRLVSFDVWDTLLSIDSFYYSVAIQLAEKLGGSPESWKERLMEAYMKVRAIRRSGGFRDSEIVPMALKEVSAFLNLNPEVIAKTISRAVENSDAKQHAIEGAEETIRFAKEFGLKLITVGNVVFWPGNHNRILLEKAGLAEFFDKQFYADELKVSKPKPEIFTRALSEFNVKPEEALHVGNSVFEDFAGAILSRMNAALIDNTVNGIVKLSGWNAYIIQNLTLLKTVLRELVCR